MNYYSPSSGWYYSAPRSNKLGTFNSVLNVTVFVCLLAFGIVSTYW
jgi:hypothetical protein